MPVAKFNDGIHKYHGMIGDSWKYLVGYKVQHIQHESGYCKIDFIKQIENVLLGYSLIQWDSGNTEISEEYIVEIMEDY